MASSGNFQRDIGGIGVPNVVQQGVVDTSDATLISLAGETAIQANRGFQEARLEKGIEQEIENVVGKETQQTPDPVNTEATFGLGQQVSEAEKKLQEDVSGLAQARDAGGVTYGEFQARVQALTRQAINRLPGRADSFRKILSNTVGDHSARLEPFRTQAKSNAKIADLQVKENMKIDAKASAIGMDPQIYREVLRANFTREVEKEQSVENASKVGSLTLESFRDRTFGLIKEMQGQSGGLFLKPDEIVIAEEGIDAIADQERQRLTELANQGGWTRELASQMKHLDVEAKREKEELRRLSASDHLEDIMKYQQQQIRYGMMLQNGRMLYIAENLPGDQRMMNEGLQAWADGPGKLDPNDPNQAAKREQLERLWESSYGGLVTKGLLDPGWQKGGFKASVDTNNKWKQLEAQGILPAQNKQTAAKLVTLPPNNEGETDAILESIRTLSDTSDGDGMSLAVYSKPEVARVVNSSPALQQQVKKDIEDGVVALVRNYRLDAETIAQHGEARKLPFGPAYDLKYADRLLLTTRLTQPSQASGALGIGSLNINAAGVDDNYKTGIQILGRDIDMYPTLFDGMSGQEWLKQRIGKLLGNTPEKDSGKKDFKEATKFDDTRKSPFQMIREAVFGAPEQTDPAASGPIFRDESGQVLDAAQEATKASDPEDFEPQGVNTKATIQNGAQEVIKAEPVLDLIGDKESTGNYNAHYGKANQSDVEFTDMSVDEVLAWQRQFVKQGSPSSAVGKYQIIRKTLAGLKKDLGLTGQEKLDENLQDEMAVALLNRRGFKKYQEGKISKEKFANNLAKEWASLPVVSGAKQGRSYYAGDGLNKALIGVEDFLSTLDDVDLSNAQANATELAPGTYIMDGQLIRVTPEGDTEVA